MAIPRTSQHYGEYLKCGVRSFSLPSEFSDCASIKAYLPESEHLAALSDEFPAYAAIKAYLPEVQERTREYLAALSDTDLLSADNNWDWELLSLFFYVNKHTCGHLGHLDQLLYDSSDPRGWRCRSYNFGPRAGERWVNGYDGIPSFSIECPEGTTRTATDSPDQVFAARTDDGTVLWAAVTEIPPDQTLDRAAEGFAAKLESGGVGSDITISSNAEITLRDGTKAYRSEITWFYIPAQISLKTQMVSSYKDGRMVCVAAHPVENPERVIPIVESLRFD